MDWKLVWILIIISSHYGRGTTMACLLEEMRANQAKADANLREMKEEMLAKLDAHHGRMLARIDSQLEKIQSCLGKTETSARCASTSNVACRDVDVFGARNVLLKLFFYNML
jgi:hypothetical protein